MKIGHCIKIPAYEIAASLGYDFAEVSGIELTALSEEELNRTAAQAEKTGMPYHAVNLYCDKSLAFVGDRFDAAQAKAYAAQLFSRASRLGIRYVGIGAPGSRNLPDGYDRSKADLEMLEFLKITASEAEQYGISILLEAVNHNFCNYINTPEEALALIDRAGLSNLGLVLDFCHMIPDGQEPEDYVFAIERASHLHIGHAELSGRRGPLTEADLPYLLRVRDAVRKAGYDRTISVEADGTDFASDAAGDLKLLREMFS